MLERARARAAESASIEDPFSSHLVSLARVTARGPGSPTASRSRTPWIRRAFERFDELGLAGDHLHGGRRDALTTPFLGRPAADVREPPGRLTHTASFAPRTSFPDDP
jgi:hypothetical protein